MLRLEFKGKQHIYAHRLTVPNRPLVPDAARSLKGGDEGGGRRAFGSTPADPGALVAGTP